MVDIESFLVRSASDQKNSYHVTRRSQKRSRREIASTSAGARPEIKNKRQNISKCTGCKDILFTGGTLKAMMPAKPTPCSKQCHKLAVSAAIVSLIKLLK